MRGFKHLVSCRCVLPQLRRLPDPPPHRFAVFSIVDDNDAVRPKFVQCNNCGIVHKVTELGRSDIVDRREDMKSITTLADVKAGMPARLAELLESYESDLSTWEAVQFVVSNSRWGEFVVLTTDQVQDTSQGKYVRIMSETMFIVESFTREEAFS